MICPHCRAGLRRKDRTGKVCAHCRRRFALDPVEHGRGMNDLRIERVARRLTGGGRLRVTLTQLWYLARTENPVTPATTGSSTTVERSWVRWLVIVPVLAVLFGVAAASAAGAVALAVAVNQGLVWFLALGFLAFVGFAVCPGVYRWATEAFGDLGGERTTHTTQWPPTAAVVPSYAAFRALMAGPWTQTYGGLPAGIMDEKGYVVGARPAEPGAVLLSLDPAVTAFLDANGVPARLGVALVTTAEELPRDDVPVVAVHDTGLGSVLLTAELRAARPERVVVDVAPPLREAMRGRHTVRLYARPAEAGPNLVTRLREEAGLNLTEAEWLAAGWWSPVAAVPPVLLERVVERAVERALELARVRGSAASVGFFSWPEPSGTSAARDGSTG
ncbi:hypothetical protein ACIP79_30215 [Streptomyces sp. NPDC088747]|uniref:hypothetical protein n=1 Tax=Streptomyces sp. NPDC088747 TaxID=3365886 RepID=UPI00381B972F